MHMIEGHKKDASY